ncbi:MAG: hypothetical protein ACRD4O_19430, partial [Bryobacteraceae bacterium]
MRLLVLAGKIGVPAAGLIAAVSAAALAETLAHRHDLRRSLGLALAGIALIVLLFFAVPAWALFCAALARRRGWSHWQCYRRAVLICAAGLGAALCAAAGGLTAALDMLPAIALWAGMLAAKIAYPAHPW